MEALALSKEEEEEKHSGSSTDISASLLPFSSCTSSVVVEYDTHQFQEGDAPYSSFRRTASKKAGNRKNEIRIFMDGVFDLMHYGHMNAFRLARSLGTHLIAGVCSDESIQKSKGPALLNEDERIALVSATKFVDQVAPDIPYVMTQEDLDNVIEKYNIDYVVHGDDPCILNGVDLYANVKKAGRFLSIPRTEGVSTTDIIGRLLRMTSEKTKDNDCKEAASASKFFMTGSILQSFSAGVKPPTANMRVIYIDGSWDMFHKGHVAILESARKRGDYLLVGVHGDASVGNEATVLNLHERVLSVLGCRYANDVLIDAPYDISPVMIASLSISEVVCIVEESTVEASDRYRYARDAGILYTIENPSNFSIDTIVDRINENREAWDTKFEQKAKQETQFYQEKYSLTTVDA